ncbi:MAG TPA: hypothetical protein VEB00_07870 [Clostridia bacterium]|nr:hypothetical protein [Clostridia bacterium]
MAYEAPSGLMGIPESTECFEAFSINDITFYIAKDVLESELKENFLDFYVEGYGKFRLEVLE